MGIQRYAFGLLELLGYKGGVAPGELSNTVLGVLELSQNYARGALVNNLFAQNAAIASGAALAQTVPPDQIWVVLHCYARVVIQGAMTQLVASVSVDSSVVVQSEKTSAIWTAGNIHATPFVPPYPWVLRPGTNITVRTYFTGVATADLSSNVVAGVLQL